MCTVTFINTGKEVIITSNRDEQVSRPEALYPNVYEIGAKALLYPKDVLGSGTWYAADEKGTVVILLNGGKEKHVSKPPYKYSRGLIVTKLISQDKPVAYWKIVDLNGIEPFTLVIYSDGCLYEAVWDGTHKHLKSLAIEESYIWSSVTLYDKEMRKERQEWFASFLNTKEVCKEAVFNFHAGTHIDNKSYGLVVDRGILQTVSITQTVISQKGLEMYYYDLLKEHTECYSFNEEKV